LDEFLMKFSLARTNFTMWNFHRSICVLREQMSEEDADRAFEPDRSGQRALLHATCGNGRQFGVRPMGSVRDPPVRLLSFAIYIGTYYIIAHYFQSEQERLRQRQKGRMNYI
jgi:hypothetical protein